MRGILFSIVFASLLVCGFIATPGFFRALNLEYRNFLDEQGTRLVTMSDGVLKQQYDIADRKADIQNREQELSSLYSAMRKEGSTPQLQETLGKLVSDISQRKLELKIVQDRNELLVDTRSEVTKNLDRMASDSHNVYLVVRALALGAIGALISILAKAIRIERVDALLQRDSAPILLTTMILGSMVAVVALGLFYTRQISIFTHSEGQSGVPDFWRVTILCLLAGAFSDRLFQAASGKVEQYLGQAPRRNQRSAPPSDTGELKSSSAIAGVGTAAVADTATATKPA